MTDLLLALGTSKRARSVLGALKRSDYFSIDHVARSPAEMDKLIERGAIQFAITIPGDFTRRVVRGDDAQILVEADATDPTATGSALAALAALPQAYGRLAVALRLAMLTGWAS